MVYGLLAFVISIPRGGIASDELQQTNDGCDIGLGTFSIFQPCCALAPNENYAFVPGEIKLCNHTIKN